MSSGVFFHSTTDNTLRTRHAVFVVISFPWIVNCHPFVIESDRSLKKRFYLEPIKVLCFS